MNKKNPAEKNPEKKSTKKAAKNPEKNSSKKL